MKLRLIFVIAPLVFGVAAWACSGDKGKATSTQPTVTYVISMPADQAQQGLLTTTTTGMPDYNRWLANWCNVTPGMTSAQAIELMGPAQPILGDGGITWEYKEFKFTAFTRSDNTIWQLQYDPYMMSAAQRAAINCPEVRR